jgi:hypothetical protein
VLTVKRVAAALFLNEEHLVLLGVGRKTLLIRRDARPGGDPELFEIDRIFSSLSVTE